MGDDLSILQKPSSQKFIQHLIDTSYSDESNEIKIKWKVKPSYMDSLSGLRVVDVFVNRESDTEFLSLLDCLRDCVDAAGDSESTKDTGKVIYHLGHYFWVHDNNNGDFTIY